MMIDWRSRANRATAAYLGVAAAATVVFTKLLDSGGEHWTTAIQIVSTLALLAVTAKYVSLTSQLVRATERPLAALRMQVQQQAAVDLGRVAHKGDQLVHSVILRYPKPDDFAEGHRTLGEIAGELDAFADELQQTMVGLPEVLLRGCYECMARTIQSSGHLYAFELAWMSSRLRVAETGAAWSIDDFRREWAADYRSKVSDSPEFEYMIGAGDLKVLEARFSELAELVNRFLSETPELDG